MNVNPTDATMVLRHCYCPLRIHTPYVTPYETRSMRALAALRMVWASAAWMAVEMLATWCVRKLRGDASGDVVGGAGEARLAREEADDGHERGCERAGGFGDEKGDADAFGEGVGVLPVARGDEAGAGHAVVGRVVPAAHLLEAKHELAELLPSSVHPQRRGVAMWPSAFGCRMGGGGGRRRCGAGLQYSIGLCVQVCNSIQ